MRKYYCDDSFFNDYTYVLYGIVLTYCIVLQWFHWITNVREIDRLPLMKGKSYMGQYMIGPFGKKELTL